MLGKMRQVWDESSHEMREVAGLGQTTGICDSSHFTATREETARRASRTISLGLLISLLAVVNAALAGPPFLTDDPEPVATGHWEFYGAFNWTWQRISASGTLPHVEVNRGALPCVQLHAVLPAVLAWNRSEPLQFGVGDLELGAKFRFVDKVAWHLQIGVFPLIFIPTGSKKRGLGSGAVEALLPVWLQMRFRPWTTYGGGGIRLAAEGQSAVVGWLVQRQLWTWLTLGAEAFVTVPLSGEAVQTQLNVGFIVDMSEQHHLLLSAGPSFGTDDLAQAYLAYQLTI